MEEQNDQHVKCRECGQALVSGDVGSGGRRNQRVKRRGTSRAKRDRIQDEKAAGDSGGENSGRTIAVSFDFVGGHFEGTARVIEEKPLVISFEWNGQRRRIQISKSDVVDVG
jgi:hypothetical protein